MPATAVACTARVKRRWRIGNMALACAMGSGVFIVCAAHAAPAGPPLPVTIVVREGQTAEEIARLADGLRQRGLAVELKIVDPRQPDRPHSGAAQAEQSGGRSLADLPSIFVEALSRSAGRIAAIPQLAPDVVTWLRAATEGHSSLLALFRLVLVIGLALTVAWLTHIAAQRLTRNGPQTAATPLLVRLRFAALRAAGDLLAIVALYIVGALAARAILAGYEHPYNTAIVLLRGAVLFGLYWSFARFLLDPAPGGERLMPIDRPDRNRRLFLLYAGLTVTVYWTGAAAFATASDRTSAFGWIYLCGTLINAYKVWWFWTIRHDISRLILASSNETPPEWLTRAMAVAVPAAAIVLPVVLWVVLTFAAVSTYGAQMATACAATQILFFAVPILAAGASALAWDRFAARERDAPAAATQAAMSASAGASVVVAGLLALKSIWDFALDMQSPQAAAALDAMVAATIVLLVGWVIFRYLDGFFDAHAPKPRAVLPGEGDAEAAPQTRIATALPLIRNFALGAVAAIVLLVALAKLGVNVTPLLAGAGIVGLAISFGSQALVRDIVSGIFFMADDAFRVGEYIDTGKHKGNVERITLRSLQLRHQNGQIHTIPYGQLASVTNFSRDWTTIKFNIRLDRATDIDKVRKIVKRVGQELRSDPEIGGDFLLPLKMQGLTDIAENAIVVRIKFTAKPIRPTYVHRLALKRIYAALTSEGVRFATNAVTVLGPAGGAGAAAAAGTAIPVKPAA